MAAVLFAVSRFLVSPRLTAPVLIAAPMPFYEGSLALAQLHQWDDSIDVRGDLAGFGVPDQARGRFQLGARDTEEQTS